MVPKGINMMLYYIPKQLTVTLLLDAIKQVWNVALIYYELQNSNLKENDGCCERSMTN